MTGDRLVELLVVNDVALASILKGRLQAHGIGAELFDLGFAGLLGGGFPGVRVMVQESRAAEARLVLDLPENEAED